MGQCSAVPDGSTHRGRASRVSIAVFRIVHIRGGNKQCCIYWLLCGFLPAANPRPLVQHNPLEGEENKRLLHICWDFKKSSAPLPEPACEVAHHFPPRLHLHHLICWAGEDADGSKGCVFPYGPEMETLLSAGKTLPAFPPSCFRLTPTTREACAELAEKHPGRDAVYKYYKKSKAPVSPRLLSNMLSKRYIKVCRHFVN